MSKTLVQIGCNVGDEYIFDLIIKEKIGFCLFVDANKGALEECKKKHFKKLKKRNEDFKADWNMKLKYLDCAVSDMDLKEVELHIPIHDNLSGHGSIFSDFLNIENFPEGFKSVKVNNFSINAIFDKYKLDTIDYLFIDVEGCDKGIFTSIDWDKYFIKNIQVEFTHWDGFNLWKSVHLNEAIFILLMRKYKVHQSSPTDIFASKILNWKENPPRYE